MCIWCWNLRNDRKNNIYNKVLMIDDDEDLAFVISDMLESDGYQVTCAETSEQAFALLECNTYHIILLDINLGSVLSLC